MHRLSTALIVCVLAACGEDEVSTASLSGGSSSGSSSSSAGSSGEVPTSGGDTVVTTSGVSNSGDESSSGGGSSSDTGGTTSPVDPGTTTSGGSTGYATTSTTSDETTSTGGDESTSTGGEPNLCGAPDLPDLGQPPAFSTCQGVASESRWCLAFGNGNTVTVLGLDSQTACPAAVLQTADIEIFAVGSLGVVGGEVFTCTSQFDGFAARVSLETGAVEVATTPCSAVTVWRGHILLQTDFPNGEFHVFPDWDALTMDLPIWKFSAQGTFNETITVQGDTLYTAWHADTRVQRFALPCGEPLGDVELAGFDDWMQGIAVTADNRFHTYGFSYNGVRSFDADVGVNVMDWPQVPIDGVALACFTQSD